MEQCSDNHVSKEVILSLKISGAQTPSTPDLEDYFLGKPLEKTAKTLCMAIVNLFLVFKYTADALCRSFYSSCSLVIQTAGDNENIAGFLLLIYTELHCKRIQGTQKDTLRLHSVGM